jgi:hypothetical protein
MKKTLQTLIAKYPKMIAFIDDETDTQDGYWLYLKDGYKFDTSTIIHEYTIAALIKSLKFVKEN